MGVPHLGHIIKRHHPTFGNLLVLCFLFALKNFSLLKTVSIKSIANRRSSSGKILVFKILGRKKIWFIIDQK